MYKASIIPKPVTEYDLRLLRIFIAVVENGGFAASESALGITRSTISVHMSNLEQRMKLTLCTRGRGGFSLTSDGQTIYHAAINLFSSINDFSLLVDNLGKELSGELVINCSDQLDTNQQKKFAKVIQLVRELSPNLHIVLEGESIHNIEKALLNDKAHVGIFPGYQKIEGLDYQEMHSEPIYLCCGEQHPFFNQVDSQITQQMLSETAAIHPGIDIDIMGRDQLKNLNLAAKAYQFNTRKAMILSGCYIGYLPQSYIQKELNQGEIRLIKPDQLTYPFSLSLVYKRHARESKKVALLKQAFNQV
ncbi:LysR family transcriptional regulator, partial [Psychromonas sp.]|nr:LysR family transcriptional regulator [Psychromonas sp.]